MFEKLNSSINKVFSYKDFKENLKVQIIIGYYWDQKICKIEKLQFFTRASTPFFLC